MNDPVKTGPWRTGNWTLTALTVAVAFALVSSWKAVGWLWKSWTELPEFSHGPLMPFIAAFLIWQRQESIENTRFTGSASGPVLIVLAGIAMLAGTVGAVYTLQQYALLAMLLGLCVSFTGWRAFRDYRMAFVVLFLMVPQPEFILNQMSAKLQLISSSIGVGIIRAGGISVFLEGNVIDLGTYRLQVVDACAGLRYLFPLMTIGLLVAYFYQASAWKRWLVFLSSIPITIIMNSVRIATVGFMVDRWGIGMAEGFIHDFQGWIVFMLSAALLIGVAASLHALGDRKKPWREVFGVDLPARSPRKAHEYTTRGMPKPLWAGLILLMVVCVAATVIPERPPVIPSRPALATFPLQLGRWHGVTQSVAGEVTAATAMDDYFLAGYTSDHGEPVSLYVSYYETQRDRRVVHSPAVCLPGSGWHIVESDVIAMAGLASRINRITIANGDNRALVFYWFDQRGRVVTSEWLVKWYLFRDSLLTRKTYGALVRVITPLAPGETADHATARLSEFTDVASAPLRRFIPR